MEPAVTNLTEVSEIVKNVVTMTMIKNFITIIVGSDTTVLDFMKIAVQADDLHVACLRPFFY